MGLEEVFRSSSTHLGFAGGHIVRIIYRSRMGHGTGAAASALLLLALGGCDLQRLTGSAATPGAVPRLSEGGTGTLGSSFLSVPATSHPADVNSTTAQPFAAVPADTWTVIRASGSVQQVWNEDCDDVRGDWVCSTGGVVPPFAETPWTLGPVAVRAEYDGGTGAELPMRGVGENAAIGLFRATRAATLTGRLNLSGRWQFKPGEIGIPSYFLTGGFTVSATSIAAPMGLTAGGADESGGREYSVEPLHGLEFVNPTGVYYLIHPGTVLWYFYRGENVSETPAGEANRVPINACAYQRTCYYVPTGPGRVQVSAYVEGRQVVLRSRPVQERTDSLALHCPASVERGQSITCTASATGGGVLTEIQWTFTDSAGHEVSGPRDSHEWGGFMVVGGEMRVNALLNGDSTSAAATIGIRARTWPNMRVRAWDAGNGSLPVHPTTYGELAQTLPPAPDEPYSTRRIDAGPNTGWYYLAAPLVRLKAEVNISRGFQAGEPFYNLQHSGTDPLTGNPFCSKSQLTALRRGAREHEGVDPSPSLVSHVEVMQMWFRNNRAQDALEALVGHASDFNASWSFLHHVEGAFLDHVSSAAYNDPNQRHTTDSPPGLVAFPRVPCAARFF